MVFNDIEANRVVAQANSALGTWRRFVIAIDGVDGSGKSTFSRYLAWKLGMPQIETDLYLDQGNPGFNYRLDDLRRVLRSRLELNRPVIIEGVFINDLLRQLELAADFLIYIERAGHHCAYSEEKRFKDYEARWNPRSRSNQILEWSDP